MSEIDKMNKQIKMNDDKAQVLLIRRGKILDKYEPTYPNLYSDPNFKMSDKDEEMQLKLVKKAEEFYEKSRLLRLKIDKQAPKPLVAFKPAPKKVVAKKVMKTPAKKKMMKMVGNAKKDIMKKSMKKPIAYDKVEQALTGKRPRKAPAKPKQVARFFVGGSVLPKGTKAPMPKKTTTMKVRKPMSAETKLKIKRGVQSYHKKCKEAMAMHSKMMKK